MTEQPLRQKYVIRMKTACGQFYWTNYVHNLNNIGWSNNLNLAERYERKKTTEKRAAELEAAYSRIFPIDGMEVVSVLVDDHRGIVEVLESEP